MNEKGTVENLNRGGNVGNRYGAGRPRSEVRASLMALADGPAREYVHGVLTGELRCPQCKGLHEYRASETTVARCAEMALRFGVGVSTEVQIANEREIAQAFARVLVQHEGKTIDEVVCLSIIEAFEKDIGIA